MPRRTLILIIVLGVITLILLAAGFFVANNQPRPQATPLTTAPSIIPTLQPAMSAQSQLALTPNPLTVASSSATVAVTIDTGENPVAGVQLVISYDPKVISITSVTPGSFLPNAQELIKNIATGEITYVLSTTNQQGIKGSGTVAHIAFRKISQAPQTTMDFLPKTLITAVGARESVLKNQQGTTILFDTNGSSTRMPGHTILLSPTGKQ